MNRVLFRPYRTLFSIFFILCTLHWCVGQVLTPPYFNLAQGRRIVASSTCGEDVPEPELFCKLVGANAEGENIVIQGQVCDHCDPKNDSKKHPAEFAVDGRETWWQSPPLSRGMKYNQVNLTIDLGQTFHVAYVIVKMGNSPRPGVWALERSNDNGLTYFPWQYFADNVGECSKYFGNVTTSITADDSVICDTQYSKIVPLEGGEIFVPLVQNRPSATDFFNSTILQEWTKATNVRFRLLRVKNLLGHLMSVARQDPTTTRRYFYSIKDISIGGRCRCNGHAETCTQTDENDPYKLICDCKDNTCGHNCEMCCPGYEQKKWSQSKSNKKFVCESCNCFGHSNQCHYNETVDQLRLSLDIHGNYEGGGVCENCDHFTEGINCDKCIHGFYRPYGKYPNETDACQPCRCDLTYSTGNCEDGTGKCECKPEYTKPNCDSCSFGHYGYPLCRACECYPNGTYTSQCNPDNGRCFCRQNYGGLLCRNCTEGYYNFPECKTCDCNSVGSLSNICDVTNGDCRCKSNFGGRTCDECHDGYYQFPSCLYCNCDVKGTQPGICNKDNGQCLCKPGYGGPRCDQCLGGYTGFPDCRPCNCSTTGSAFSVCDITGKCTCLPHFAGKLCDQCSPGYYLAPHCHSCNCDAQGTNGVSCDNDGNCLCKKNFEGQKCDRCKEGYYNFPTCEECNFDPAGVVSTFTGCRSLKPGEIVIQCKPNVQGKICNECKDLYWNLRADNQDGCEECSCNRSGTLGRLGICDSKSGQCTCKPTVSSRKCDQCSDGWYNLTDGNLFGCTDCNCDLGGSQSNICNKQTGQCTCLPRVGGRNCKEPIGMHYFPTLHQYQFEVEDGRTPTQTQVRYGFDDKVFPGYSWKGYAVYSHLQNETIHPVMIDKPSLYRIVLRYINFNPQAVTGTISAIPEYSSNLDVEQKFQVVFKPTATPAFVTVAGISGNMPSPFVLNPGPWIIKIKNEKNLFLDYFVLIPAEYYEGGSLVSNITTPCTLEKTDHCRLYLYPSISSYDQIKGVGAYISVNDIRSPVREFYDELEKPLGIPRMPKLSKTQQELYFNLILSRPGNYAFVVNYGTVANQDITVIQVQGTTQFAANKGSLTIYPCRYRTLCRQVVSDKDGKVAVWNVDSNNVNLILKGTGEGIGIDSIAAIPLDQWSLDYVKPKPSCVINDTKCVPSIYLLPPDSKQFDFKTGNEKRISKTLPSTILDNNTELVYLDDKDSTIDITGKVPRPGPYTFILHYYQPDHPDFDGTGVIHNGQMYDTKVRLHHCPGTSGCRSVVKQQNGNNVFQLTENFVFSLTARKGVWVQYVLLIPSDQYTNEMITELPFDQTNMFISNCGQNHFHLNTSQEGFCKEATFSVTTKYNHGALPCRCEYDGSWSFECEKFGGQCPCRENVIGRRCDHCKTGYFGFPNCRSCNCSSTAVCDSNSGECICPQNVIGEKCNQCRPYTFGFDPIIGCEDCNCNIYGAEGDNLQCDLFTGACKCKKNIEGRMCDRCVAGFYSFPYCEKCTCDLRGTTEEICNQANAACLCKSNVQGAACDVCKDGTFNLQRDEPAGCTKCFCFGRTSRCTSSTLFTSAIISYENWTLANVNIEKTLERIKLPTPVEVKPAGISVNMGFILETPSYFVAPEIFVGNKLTAYGGSLNYTVHYTGNPDRAAVGGPDVILYGANTYIQYTSVAQPDRDMYFPISVKMVETEFTNPSSERVTREDFMQILQNLSAIFIKASYIERGEITELVGVSFEIAIPEYSPSSGIALAVEQCNCPANYVGLSCEDCADGYYRSSTGLFGGNCIPCQCNGHAATCDKATGICIDCKHNTKGDHCEKCEMGYYGNSTVGSPNDCLICACPLPILSNNFATGCDINESGDRIICDCIAGYTGDHCDRCAPGFYGDPTVNGAQCVPCQCNGNINASEVNSCDPYTGKCLKCLNNTSGDSCERCAPGYFGDAIGAKNCQLCDCDTCGTKECNHSTGQCTCYENIVGEKCDRCADNHYGFSTCTGCRACNCANASQSLQCDDLTGYCRCKDGVVGQTCHRCAAGYWKYSENGCTSCGCNIGYSIGVGCNTTTGLCECLPGVVGDKCDACPYRSVLIPNEGCYTCDNCTHGLLDVTDQLKADFDPVYNKFQSTADGYFTSVRLTYINTTAYAMTPNISDVLSHQFDLSPYENNITVVKREKETSLRKIQSIYNDLVMSTKKSGDAIKNALDTEQMINNVDDKSRTTVHDIESLFYNLDTGAGSQIDYAIKEGKMILQRIQDIDIDEDKRLEAETAEQKARQVLSQVNDFSGPRNNTAKNLETTKKNVEKLQSKLEELQGWIENAHNMILTASNDNQSEKKTKLMEKINSLDASAKEANEVINDATKLIGNITKTMNESKPSYEELSQNLVKLKSVKEETSQSLQTLMNGINAVREPVFTAKSHSEELERQASIVNSIIKREVTADNAVKAANSYKDIANASAIAMKSATDANTATNSAEEKLQGIDTKIINSNEKSSELIDAARKKLEDVQQNLAPELSMTLQKQAAVEKNINQTNEKVDALKKSVEKQKEEIKQMKNLNADDVSNNAKNMMENTKNIADELPKKLTEAKDLYSKLDEASKSIQQTGNYLNQVDTQDPEMVTRINKLKAKPEELKVKEKTIDDLLNELKQKITITGDLAAKIKVGVSLNRNIAVELPLPDTMLDQGSSNVLSLFFKTEQPNGLLLYAGNEASPRVKRDTQKTRRPKTEDFLALEMENGYLLLTSSLGEPSTTNLVLNDRYVADNKWYKAEIVRTGKSVNLTLTIQETPRSNAVKIISKTGYYPGESSVLNLDKDHSKFYIGGLPSSFEAPKAIKVPTFSGQVEELTVDGVPVGLWNFVSVSTSLPNTPINTLIKGAVERDILLPVSESKGCRFSDGYLVLKPVGISLLDRFEMLFSFKTTSLNGLLFLAYKDTAFISVELKQGFIYFQFNIGLGLKSFHTPTQYNDGQWHKIFANRVSNKGDLIVDGATIRSETSDDRPGQLQTTDYLYFGGYPGDHMLKDVVKDRFEGCIDGVQINDVIIDLNNNLNSHNIISGCPDKFIRFVSFEEGSRKYIRWSSANVPANEWSTEYPLSLTLRIKTLSRYALIAYGIDGSNSFYLTLNNGSLIFKVGKSEVTSGPNTKYNDDRWHSIMASHDGQSLVLIVDDFDTFKSEIAPAPLPYLRGTLYFGSVPSDIDASAAIERPFVGALGDATLNGIVINLDRAYDRDKNKEPVPITTPAPAEPIESSNTTTLAPTTPPPAVTVAPGCLPIYPSNDPDINKESGDRFGTSRISFQTYEFDQTKLKGKVEYSLELKTVSTDGIIFYVTEPTNRDYIVLYLKEAKLYFSYACGPSSTSATSEIQINEGEWHTISFSIDQNRGMLTVGGQIQSTAVGCQQFNVAAPYYLGGADVPTLNNSITTHLQGFNKTFVGCIRKFAANSVEFEKPTLSIGVIPCSSKVESGTFFPASGGYLKAFDQFKVGRDLEINFEIRPRNTSGVLLGVHSRKFFLVLQMIDGAVKLTADSGNGPFYTIFKPQNPNYFCDERWHKITALKSKSLVILTIDGNSTDFGTEPLGTKLINTNHPLYIGGYPADLSNAKGIETGNQYVGCMRNLVINGQKYDLGSFPTFGNVMLNVCPNI